MEKQGEKIKLKTALALAIIQNKTPGLLFKDYIKDAILESADPSEYWRMRYNAANKELFKLKSRLFDLEMQNNELPEQPERNKEVINRIDLDFRGCIKQDVSMGKKLVPNGLKYSIGNLLNDTYKYLPFNHLFQSSMVIIETIENHLENKDPVSQPYFELLLFCLLKYITMSSRLDYKMKENLFGKFLSWIRISCGSHSICYSMDIHSDCTIPESLLSLCLKLTQTTLEFRVSTSDICAIPEYHE
ncbi:hypothetical protein NADFUDRAFT_49545 [Nadsonia fulvescens var. elongata DSM 6958]|uniref:Uncharacterized protein n=1 Tax=Nadsonia fulvescens var. elongata DSM 6958 TaxID=857566 RepID=A0A1E3PQB7_9ASCO|nr:hypothetical protein NADFUDRAFT_49545 [Nadsonia fulvescens var. elongata DSM 6958]